MNIGAMMQEVYDVEEGGLTAKISDGTAWLKTVVVYGGSDSFFIRGSTAKKQL